MLRDILRCSSLALVMGLSGCSGNSDMPTVPPPPPPGTIKEAPPQTALPDGFMKDKQGKPDPNTPKNL